MKHKPWLRAPRGQANVQGRAGAGSAAELRSGPAGRQDWLGRREAWPPRLGGRLLPGEGAALPLSLDLPSLTTDARLFCPRPAPQASGSRSQGVQDTTVTHSNISVECAHTSALQGAELHQRGKRKRGSVRRDVL